MKATLDGYRASARTTIEALTYHARLAANLSRYPKNKYLPTLEKLLKPAKSDAKQSKDDMLAAFQEMQAAGAAIHIRKVA
ncbi:hypothetical protein [Sphingobium sp. YG1]|uniref:hypothetical protein n=1 Tax=Sphingobium sp. YG1 TaxID=2082188 RepID=UPI000DBAF8EF|nr:hypothetical protein [Sphingobium sp. YG1]BBD01837.1 hypothetical protein YGS_C1P3092 [Sphingobium sp. YG1]